MDDKRRKIVLISVFLLIFAGCRPIMVKKRIFDERAREKEIISHIELAEDYYAKGVMNNLRRNWVEARAALDTALSIIAELELLTEEDNKAYSQRINTLLREIAYDYRIALLGSNVLDSDNAPAILAYALDESLDQKRLMELASKLKAVPEKVTYDLPILWNDEVKEKVVYFQTEIRKPFLRWLNNSTRYVSLFKEILKRHGLPQDLAYLPLVESGYESNAYSWAHAVGIWQFIASTARIFGLEVNWWVDERRDPIKSTHAACRYIKKLYNQFNDWELALAAYNCGEVRVEREIKRTGSRSFWDLNLPRQTRNYVPLFMAALAIAKNPEVFGFTVEEFQPFEYDSVFVDGGTDLRVVAKCADTTYDAIRFLNPHYLRWSLPPDNNTYIVRIPKGKAEIFAEKFKNMPSEKRKASFVEHKVKKGETITHIASKYGVSSSAIVSANKIDNPRSIRTGMKLLIPLNKGSETLSQNKDKEPKSSKNIHIVKRGDTIIKIAQQHGLSVNEILRINNLNRGSFIRPGDTIFLSQESGNLRGSSGKMVQREKFEHIVKKGESLYSIARQYGVSIDDLVEWNELPSDNLLLRVGQKIFIMKHRAIAGVSDNREKVIYTVKKGDSLYKIAKMFGTTIGEIKRLNNLSTNRIKENQRIVIYKKKGIEVKKMVYVVRPGDTLWSIATSFGVSVESILKANGLLDPNKIKAGDELAIYINE